MAERKSYNPAKMLNPDSSKVGALMLDKLTRCGTDRHKQPLEYHDYISYSHREPNAQYNLKIGDCVFVLPPEFIMVNTESQTDQIVTIRQESTQKEKHGHHKKIILIDLVFSDLEQINGYKVPAPKHKTSDGTFSEYYYVDGLRQMLAQFKCTPFLPITNSYINSTHSVFVVALQSITISTVNGFPNVLKAQLTLQDVEMMPYLDAPSVCFREMIDWDLFRYYYQSFTTETHRYKRLQSLPKNPRYNHFRISVLDPNIFDTKEAQEASIIDICTDKKIFGENGSNYITYLDSMTQNINVEEFECGYSNILTNIQLSQMSSPTIQFIGGMDTIYNIKFRTDDISIITSLQQCQTDNDALIRYNPELQSCLGFVKLESELVEFTGSLFVMIDSISTATVPGFPDLYTIQINCVSYDIMQSEREQLNGFRPFDDVLYTGTGIDQKKVYKGQAISNTTKGIMRKTLQDMYAEEQFMKMELYPDLRLPTYSEIDIVVEAIKLFRENNKLSPLPYDKYPRDPICGLHGQNTLRMSIAESATRDNQVATWMKNQGVLGNEAALPYNIKALKEYEGYVDPDFYVFYPLTYEALYNNADEKPTLPNPKNGYEETIAAPSYKELFLAGISKINGTNLYKQEMGYIGGSLFEKANKEEIRNRIQEHRGQSQETTNNNVSNSQEIANDNVSNYTSSSMVDKFIQILETRIGDPYKMGQKGTTKGSQIDCSGFICWGLQQCGALPSGSWYSVRMYSDSPGANFYEQTYGGKNVKNPKFTLVKEYPLGNGQITGEKLWKDMQSGKANVAKGDVIVTGYYETGEQGHVLAYIGDGMTIEATSAGDKVVRKLKLTDYKGGGDVGIRFVCRPNKFIEEAETAAKSVEKSKPKEITDKKIVDDTASKEEIKAGIATGEWYIDDNGKAQKREYNEDYYVSMLEYTQVPPVVMYLSRGREQCAKAFAQMIYDIYTSGNVSSLQEAVAPFKADENYTTETNLLQYISSTDKSWASVALYATGAFTGINNQAVQNALGDFGDIIAASKENQAVSEYVRRVCKEVFENCEKAYNKKIMRYSDANTSAADYNDLSSIYTKIGEKEGVTFWGMNENSANYKLKIDTNMLTASGSAIGLVTNAIANANGANGSTNFTSVLQDRHQTFGKDSYSAADIRDAFGEPILLNVNKVYNNMHIYNENTNLQMLSSFTDQYHYSRRCRLVRAFPTYLIAFADEDGAWYDGKKLWTNYYTHKSCVEIQTHAAYDMPVETATVTITDTIHALDKTDYGVRNEYNFMNDSEVSSLGKWLYRHTGLSFGLTGAKLTSDMLRYNQIISINKKLRENARVHIRIGYGSDPGSLATVMNGVVTELSVGGDQINMVISSDGNELITHPVSADEDDTNDGALSLFGLGSKTEPSNIIADVMCQRESWINDINSSWSEQSKFGIEHFGTYRSAGDTDPWVSLLEHPDGEDAQPHDVEENTGAAVGGTVGAVGAAAAAVAIGAGPVGWIILGGVGVGLGILGGRAVGEIFNETDSRMNTSGTPSDLWNEWEEQWDLTLNIYKADYRGFLYTEGEFLFFDGEDNVIYDKFNMTPWDVLQTCAQSSPEYIVKPSYFQFDSRLFFGLPFFFERDRYFICNVTGDFAKFSSHLWCEAKPASQMHYITSIDGIIDNQVRVSSKHTYTNVKVLYLRGGDGATTCTVHSDDTIDPSRQKTKILETSLAQDAIGPDWFYTITGLYSVGQDSAIRTGVSELIYGWQQQYQGQLICTGQPGIKPNDHMMINDSFASINGLCMVREVNHSFSASTGFTTSIVPGMVVINSGDNNSGMTQYVANYLTIFQMMAQYTLYRNEIYTESEYYSNEFAYVYCSDSAIKDVTNKETALDVYNGIHTGTQVVGVVSGMAGTTGTIIGICLTVKKAGGIKVSLGVVVNTVAENARRIYNVLSKSYYAAKAAKTEGAISTVFSGVGSLAMQLKNFQFVVSNGKATTFIGGAAKTAVTGIKGLLKISKGTIILTLISAALNHIMNYISNKHRIWLVPLWKDEQPFVTNVKDGENILLFGSGKYADDYEDTSGG